MQCAWTCRDDVGREARCALGGTTRSSLLSADRTTVFSDTTGAPVMTLSTNSNPYARVFIGTAGDTTVKAAEGQEAGTQLFTAKRKMGVKHHMAVAFTNAADGQPTTLELRGDVLGNKAAVLTADGRETVAHFTRTLDGIREPKVMTVGH